MGRNLGSAFRKELTNLDDKDQDLQKSAMNNLRSIVKSLDPKVIHVFLSQISETKEIGSESNGFTVSLIEELARAHGVKISPHVETIIMPMIIRTLTASQGSLPLQQACSKTVASIARYGIDPSTPEDKRKTLIHSICKPLSDSLIDTQQQQHLALGSAVCLKALVDSDNWKFASDEMVNKVCESLAVALQATSSEAMSHMALVIALSKRNPFIIDAYVRLLVKSGLRFLELGVVEGDAQKRVLSIQMLNFLMKNLEPKSVRSEVNVILKEMVKLQKDDVHFVRSAAYETTRTAERLIRETDSPMSTTPYSRHDDEEGDEEEEEDVLFSGVASGRTIVSGSPLVTFEGYDQDNESVWFHKKNRSFDFNESVGSRTNQSRSSRRSHRHGFIQDPFIEQREQCSCDSSSSSSICANSGTTTPTEGIYEEQNVEEAEVETETEQRQDMRRSNGCGVLRLGLGLGLGLGLSFFFAAFAAGGSFIWMYLQDDMLPPHLVPT